MISYIFLSVIIVGMYLSSRYGLSIYTMMRSDRQRQRIVELLEILVERLDMDMPRHDPSIFMSEQV